GAIYCAREPGGICEFDNRPRQLKSAENEHHHASERDQAGTSRRDGGCLRPRRGACRVHGIRVHWVRGFRHVLSPVLELRFRLLVIEEICCPVPAIEAAHASMRLIWRQTKWRLLRRRAYQAL